MADKKPKPPDDQPDRPVYVFAQGNMVLHDKSGMPFRLIGGQAWLADDPLVHLHPDAFGSEPPIQFSGRSTPPKPEEMPEYLRPHIPHVEQATRDPGDMRG